MRFPTPLFASQLNLRYKRFLADMQMPDGTVVTAHCPNPGAMTGLADPGMRCWLARARPGGKLDWGWKLVELPGGMAVIDTGIANRVVAEALEARGVPGLPAYDTIRPEARLDSESRIDFRLEGADGPVWVEVKSVTLARNGWAEFPDTRTARGARHLRALTAAVQRGERAAMVYLLARDDCDRIRIAADIDPAYAEAFDQARAAGVAMLGLSCRITPEEVVAGAPVEVG
ncbi:DNA/RNA nuclease SfsA [Gemmobacter sp.]|uniref:DNA/RNA nuclease SfsA n=1 Tax=Gemmobacter sp. TaxID=1898957 RepID=UPI002AFF2FC0|nr:DNA/RNA nuclease SfsA [Gemmobacter sp.]